LVHFFQKSMIICRSWEVYQIGRTAHEFNRADGLT
jgi:hypothetical protein